MSLGRSTDVTAEKGPWVRLGGLGKLRKALPGSEVRVRPVISLVLWSDVGLCSGLLGGGDSLGNMTT